MTKAGEGPQPQPLSICPECGTFPCVCPAHKRSKEVQMLGGPKDGATALRNADEITQEIEFPASAGYAHVYASVGGDFHYCGMVKRP